MPYLTRPLIHPLAAKKPRDVSFLSATVLVTDEVGDGYCYVRFTEHDVVKLGKKMPYGVGPAHPAFLHVVKVFDKYEVYGRYLDGYRKLLWVADELPAWCKTIRRNYGTKEKKERPRG